MTEIKSILPPNATPLQKDIEAATASRLLSLDTDAVRRINNPGQCPVELLPWLAWAMSVDVWNNEWTETVRRNVIRESVQVHKQKGTIGALRRALSAFLYAELRIEEWFEYGGAPYTFRVRAVFREEGLSVSDTELIYSTIMQTKNLRSHLDYLRPELETVNERPKAVISFGHLETTTIYPREE